MLSCVTWYFKRKPLYYVFNPGGDRVRRQNSSRGQGRIIRYMQDARVSAWRAERAPGKVYRQVSFFLLANAWDNVQTGELTMYR